MRFLGGLGLVLLIGGCAVPTATESQGDSTSNIMGGQADSADSSVGMVRIMHRDDQAFQLCSATLIGPQLMITAAHCAFDETTGEGLASVDVSFDASPDLTAPFGAKNPGFIIPNSKYLGAESMGAGVDVACIVLEHPPEEDVPIMPLADVAAVAGDSLEAIGYGESEDGVGVRRSGIMAITTVSTEIRAGGNGTSLCFGDSGGPLVKDGKLVGINAHIEPTTCAGSSFFTRIDKVGDFIKRAVADAQVATDAENDTADD